MTVFNVEKARMISDHAQRLGKRQDLLIRPIGPRDVTFPYMEGGFVEKDAVEAIKKINTFEGVRVVGLTIFRVSCTARGQEAAAYGEPRDSHEAALGSRTARYRDLTDEHATVLYLKDDPDLCVQGLDPPGARSGYLRDVSLADILSGNPQRDTCRDMHHRGLSFRRRLRLRLWWRVHLHRDLRVLEEWGAVFSRPLKVPDEGVGGADPS